MSLFVGDFWVVTDEEDEDENERWGCVGGGVDDISLIVSLSERIQVVT